MWSPPPLWGRVRVGGQSFGKPVLPTPALPHKGGGSNARNKQQTHSATQGHASPFLHASVMASPGRVDTLSPLSEESVRRAHGDDSGLGGSDHAAEDGGGCGPAHARRFGLQRSTQTERIRAWKDWH